MRGFAVGTLALIVLYTLVQQGTADKAATAGGVLTALMRRALSPEVAGVPNRSTTKTLAEPPRAPAQGGTPIPIPNI